MSASTSRDGFAPTTHAEIEADERRRRIAAMAEVNANNAEAIRNASGGAGAAPAWNGTPALSGLPLGLGGLGGSSGQEPPVYRKDGSVSPRPQVANRRKRRFTGTRLVLTDAEVAAIADAWIARAHRTRTRTAGWNAIAHYVVQRATARGAKWSAESAQRSVALGKAARAATLWPHADSGARASGRPATSVRERSARRLAMRVTASRKRWRRKDGKRVAVAILERLAKHAVA